MPESSTDQTIQSSQVGQSTFGLPFFFYLLLSLLVIAYVGVLTGNRSEMPDADAWEHHRAVLAMSQNMIDPGNPTYTTDEPSIRYSPYTLGLAFLVKTMGVDAYDVLSGAAVFNTLLFVIAVWVWLRSYGLANAAPWVLLCAIFLYGQPPGYANSLALSDLPWHQVNPSALAMPLMLLCWAWLVRVRGAGLIGFVIITAPLVAFCVLSHGMSGVMGGFGLFITAIAGDKDRVKRVAAVVITGVTALALAYPWPWYDFVFAVTHNPDKWYWFNPAIFKAMLLIWCLPALVACTVTLPMRDEPFIRTALVATLGLLCVAALGAVAGSPTLARLPLAGLIFPQAAVGVYLYKVGVARPADWAQRLKHLADRDPAVMNRALVQTLVAALVVVLALPNFWLTLREPHLARKWVAEMTGREDKQPDLWQNYDALLSPIIQTGDVVLADSMTAWPVPSFGGRIVSAHHLEFFTPDQLERLEDTQRFFTEGTPQNDRKALISKYNVRWLLLDREYLAPAIYNTLAMPDTVIAKDDRRVLMDAQQWLKLSGSGGATEQLEPHED